MDVLRQHRLEQKSQKAHAAEAWAESALVFTNEIGGHLVAGTVYKNFKKIAANTGIDSTRFHDLRHSYAVAALQSGDDVKTVQENLGHHSAAFTLDVYGHVTEKMKRESAARMESFIKGIKNL